MPRRKSLLDEMEEFANSEEMQLLDQDDIHEEYEDEDTSNQDIRDDDDEESQLPQPSTLRPVVEEGTDHTDHAGEGTDYDQEISYSALYEEAVPSIAERRGSNSSKPNISDGSTTNLSMHSMPQLHVDPTDLTTDTTGKMPRRTTFTEKVTPPSLKKIKRLGLRQTSGGLIRSLSRGSSHQSSQLNHSSSNLSSSTLEIANTSTIDLNNTAAAAAIVAASSQATIKRGVQFNQGDHVLVMLSLLNITTETEDKNSFTTCPVNKLGYPKGEGKTEQQKQGPYNYLLCIVTNIHFDEDERYYTVRRADNKMEQRADPGWMEPIFDDGESLFAALAAAEKTRYSLAANDAFSIEGLQGWARICTDCLRIGMVPVNFFKRRMITFYREKRARLKLAVTRLLRGEEIFVKIHLTPINFLVACSITFLLLTPLSLAVLPPHTDRAVAIVNLVVWLVLALELFFEIVIRPPDFRSLLHSDKAYAPSTARYLNAFHLVFEVLALLLYIPEFPCVFRNNCNDSIPLSLIWSSVNGVLGKDRRRVIFARFVFGLSFLRVFPLVRHWKQMWLMHAFNDDISDNRLIRRLLLADKKETDNGVLSILHESYVKFGSPKAGSKSFEANEESLMQAASEDDQRLKNAATIGTALMTVNTHRTLLFLIVIVALFPAIFNALNMNSVLYSEVDLLFENNIVAHSDMHCEYLRATVCGWLRANARSINAFTNDAANLHLNYAEVSPVRCDWQTSKAITDCALCIEDQRDYPSACSLWDIWRQNNSISFLANSTSGRKGGFVEITRSETRFAAFSESNSAVYSVRAIYNVNYAVSYANASLFFLLISTVFVILVGLSIMRADAVRLVLDPLRRMLKIVVRYAENPLSQNVESNEKDDKRNFRSKDELGNYETEQLINAISKIADLLRKCWGVAGAGIISTNLARTKDGKTVVFNPTVPGKRVYALFGFVAINHFDRHLRALESEIMILINDVSRVVHDEVYRWALNDSGQCNKNLGSAFLMVFRIGDFSEVHDKKKRATDVVFDAQIKQRKTKLRKRKVSKQERGRGRSSRSVSSEFDLGDDGTLQLASLPGIQSFADRAVIGFLKSFAGVHRDVKLRNWKQDFRLGAGVGAFNIEILYGMDAGWAVEGAVGSEYKIDATYLSPHVNMASRMTSATKQYGTTMLLSQAVEELMSKTARTKLRHVDTVYVKGSSVAQRIFTYDARYEGVDFFLFDKSPEQADLDAQEYSSAIWEMDQDLRAMRQHVTNSFMTLFKRGMELYLEGDWERAVEKLEKADNMMIANVIEEGFLETSLDEYGPEIFNRHSTNDDVIRLRQEYGDGVCKCLIQFMEKSDKRPPTTWHGVRTLVTK